MPKSISPLKINDRVVSHEREMVELLSNQLKSVFTIEDQSNVALIQPQSLTEATIENMCHIGSNLVRTYIKKLKPNKAEGPDEIYARIFEGMRRIDIFSVSHYIF